jgi:uncharacterized protein YkwD
MATKVTIAAALASLAVLAASPAAHARQGLGQQRALAPAERTATASVLLAPTVACPGQNSLEAPQAVQEEAMRCMVNFARTATGLAELAPSTQLAISAPQKSADVLRCDEFSHFACGREFSYWIQQSGYTGESCWRAGENLAWGIDEHGSARAIFRAWMASPTHRGNLLGDYREIGIDVTRGELDGRARTSVWTAHLGSHCES